MLVQVVPTLETVYSVGGLTSQFPGLSCRNGKKISKATPGLALLQNDVS